MKIKLIIAAMLATSSLAIAQPYQFEVGASLTHYDPDQGSSDKSLGASGEYHFEQVQTANRPLAEAAFLQRSSHVYARGSNDLDIIYTGVNFYIPNTLFYVAAELQRVDVNNYRNNDWGVRFGLTPIDGLLLWTSYYDEPGYDLNIHAKYVLDLGYNNAVNLEAGYTDLDEDNHIYLFGDFYFNRTFSVGAGYNDYAGEDAFTLRTRKFFTDRISGEAAFTDADNGKSLTVGASIRF